MGRVGIVHLAFEFAARVGGGDDLYGEIGRTVKKAFGQPRGRKRDWRKKETSGRTRCQDSGRECSRLPQ